MSFESIIIFTDGASRGNPGPGGFGAILISPGQNEKNYELGITNYAVRELGGCEKHTTNNRMELQAAISALSVIHNSSFIIRVYTDSAYLLNGITRWVHGWQKNGWKTAGKKEVENQDLWQKLIEQTTGKKIEWKLVKGHAGVAGNVRCDEIATAFADGNPPPLYSGVLKNYGIRNIMDVSTETETRGEKREAKTRKSGKAYSYVSRVGGVIQTHQTWAECEQRVKGARGAKYQKAFSPTEESALIKSWQ